MADLDVTRSETLTLTDTGAGRLSPLLRSISDTLDLHDAGYTTSYDSGALAAGIYDVVLPLGYTAAAQWVVIHRNAANTGDIGERLVVYTPATGSRHIRLRIKFAQSGAAPGLGTVCARGHRAPGVDLVATFVELYGALLDRELGSADRSQLFTTARRQAAINEAQGEWVRLTEALVRELVFTLVDEVSEYDLESRASDFWLLARQGPEVSQEDSDGNVTVFSGDDLVRRDVVWLNREEPGWRTASAGTPTCYYLREDAGTTKIGFWPAPDIAAGEIWTARVPYVAQPADLSDDTDEPFTVGNSALRLRPWHKALAHYAAAQLELLRRDSAAHDLQMQRFSGYVTQFIQAHRPRGGTHVVFVRDYRGEARRRSEDTGDPWR